MLLAAHVTVGAAVGTAVGHPILAVILSFISHYLLDCVPHWHLNMSQKSIYPKLLLISDFILTIIITVIAVKYLPDFINSKHAQELIDHKAEIDGLVYDVASSPYPVMISYWTIIACCIASVLPGILMIPKIFFKKEFSLLKWNQNLKNILHNSDQRFMGKVVQVATIIVFGLYSFRLLPNSESPLFTQIILLMLVIVAILSLLETFSSSDKNTIKKTEI